MVLKNERGQTMVEYILLLAVVVSVVYTFMNSNAYKKLFGSAGSFGKIAKTQTEAAYRYSTMKVNSELSRDNRDGSIHPSYHDENAGGTRFFGPKVAYP